MMIERLYWMTLWNDAVRRTKHVRQTNTALERHAFERRMQALSNRSFLRYPPSA